MQQRVLYSAKTSREFFALTWAHEPSVDLGLASHGSARLLSETGRVCGEQAEWYPVALFLKVGNGEILGGLLGDIWAA
jgi:hypothetical protein